MYLKENKKIRIKAIHELKDSDKHCNMSNTVFKLQLIDFTIFPLIVHNRHGVGKP